MAVRDRKTTLRLRSSRNEKSASLVETVRSAGHGWVRRLTRQHGDGGVRAPAEPPPCPPGWTAAAPDFVGIGAQRSGTTRWFRLIASHPEVASSPLAKELHFFDQFYEGGFTDADAERYHEYFPSKEGLRTGEWTPLYGNAPWVPGMLARAAPQARLLMLVRDPVERFVSGLQHNARVAREHGLPVSSLAPVEAFARGLYHAQLAGMLAHFDPAQLLVLQYERCLREPLTELRRTLEFIGVDDVGFAPPNLDANPNPQHAKPVMDAEIREAYTSAYRADVLALAADFPDLDLSLWPNFADLAG